MATKDQINKAWDNADKMRGKDPDLYRKDPYGNQIYHHSHGKSSEMGWDVDHISPRSRGGSDASRTLQALNSSLIAVRGTHWSRKVVTRIEAGD